MAFTPSFSITAPMLLAAESLGAAQAIATLLPLPLATERALRRKTSIEVAHHSTWIENRTLALEEAAAAIQAKTADDPSRAKAAQEVRSYFQALELIDESLEVAADETWIRRLHACIMGGRRPGRPRELSEYRESNVRIGAYAYVPPAWQEVPALMAELAAWSCGPGRALPTYIFAGVLAYQFVTIHPFVDGNGRTCRALATWALRRTHDPKGLLNVEELYVRDIDAYYDALQMGLSAFYDQTDTRPNRANADLTPWLEYFCELVGEAAAAMRRAIEGSFRERHADTLADPIAELPTELRRIVASLGALAEPINATDVAERVGVTTRTAREWLQRWRDAGWVEPTNPRAQRVHAVRLTSAWRAALGESEDGAAAPGQASGE
ncbi:MAG: Fic family protein [Nannocystis sp.]|nr:Fic family protein [Nannocystis sp.]